MTGMFGGLAASLNGYRFDGDEAVLRQAVNGG
jgi:hypothetical protein